MRATKGQRTVVDFGHVRLDELVALLARADARARRPGLEGVLDGRRLRRVSVTKAEL